MRSAKSIRLEQPPHSESNNYCVGQIVEITSNGVPIIDYQGNELGPIQARSLVVLPPGTATDLAGRSVLLTFECGDAWRPIIVGLVYDYILSTEAGILGEVDFVEPSGIEEDGKRIRIEKKEEILLSCGKSSIKLRADGKLIIKGSEIVSRSSGANKIRGASVNIN